MLDNPSVIVIAIGGLLALIIIVLGLVLTRRENSALDKRLEDLTESGSSTELTEFINSSAEANQRSNTLDTARVSLLKPLNDLLGRGRFGKTWRTKLARANLKLTVAEFAVAHVVGAGAGFGIFYLLSPDIMGATIAGAIGFFAPRLYVGRLISQRMIAFETQLPDTLSLWVNALRSGYSVLQAMEAIAKDAPEPTQTEFARVVKEVQIGIDVPDALDHLLERVESPDLDLVITAVNIQREVGGNLAEILEVIGSTIRERIKLKGEIRVLTSQGRITGYLISFLPIGLALFLNLASPGYMGDMFANRACGWPMLGAGLALIGIGTAVIQKIVDIEI
ncbi:MAG: type II secretion system F family protein [Anaerolineae bacterium]